MLFELMLTEIQKKYPDVHGKLIDIKGVVFEERVKMNCFYCGKYNSNWKCPPHVPQLDWKMIMEEYENGAFIWLDYEYKEKNFEEIRRETSIVLHKALLESERFFYQHNIPMAISFIGGSCKLCKDGCGKDRCNNPYMARSPLESISVNVVKSALNNGIEIKFPPESSLMRIGLVLW